MPAPQLSNYWLLVILIDQFVSCLGVGVWISSYQTGKSCFTPNINFVTHFIFVPYVRYFTWMIALSCLFALYFCKFSCCLTHSSQERPLRFLTHSSRDGPLRFLTHSSRDGPLLHISQCKLYHVAWGNLGNLSSLCMVMGSPTVVWRKIGPELKQNGHFW